MCCSEGVLTVLFMWLNLITSLNYMMATLLRGDTHIQYSKKVDHVTALLVCVLDVSNGGTS